ncbi:MAG: rhodanese-like domain-containing protein [Candidatus Thermoplasmatota archaeon]|nr:rhodanese-like domain-containing protein [Candidatus Thermoplasmatota archaeon]MEC7142113.1 rhodanese-like domain-containing protein [Candidatus Thermoplasmatota archaeon]
MVASGMLETETYVNIAGYRFIDLSDRDELRAPFLEICLELELKGTVLLSPNGINFFVAGTHEAIEQYVSFLEEDERFQGISLHISYSEYQPFKRMLVRLKNEIISLGMDEIKPAERKGQYIQPKEFKKWLDEGKEVMILDTRNDYELRVGTFENAIDLDIKSFREFPEATKKLEQDKTTPVVMFCTGGIRCEKASVVMENQGWENVYQIKGGILGYFKECGGAHWNGDCFVFDKRVSVNSELEESDHVLCFECRNPLSVEEQKSEDYVIEQYCPYCVDKKK